MLQNAAARCKTRRGPVGPYPITLSRVTSLRLHQLRRRAEFSEDHSELAEFSTEADRRLSTHPRDEKTALGRPGPVVGQAFPGERGEPESLDALLQPQVTLAVLLG